MQEVLVGILGTALEIIEFVFQYITIVNIFFAIVVIFFQRKDPRSVWAWLLILILVPIVGFIFYLIIGIDFKKSKMFRNKAVEDRMREMAGKQESLAKGEYLRDYAPNYVEWSDLMLYNLESSTAIMTDSNDVRFIFDGKDKFAALLADMEEATTLIHIQYYIIKNDLVFDSVCEVLRRKVRQGVKVRILYDAMGCRKMPRRVWRRLKASGIEVVEFFPAFLGRFHLRVNFRNHRKIVVIDNRIAYVGGFNIAKEYIGLKKRFGYWRDTHLRIEGEAVMALATRFLLDFNYSARQDLFVDPDCTKAPKVNHDQRCLIQIVSSGPDSQMKNIRNNYLRMIHKAKESIYIQTPYFIPDEAVMEALLIAVYSGVSVNLMIPCKPDHPFVYWATYSWFGDLVKAGANCYTYDRGFIHAKGMVVDGKVLCYGTANMDNRSFELNFEVNATIYNEILATQMQEVFLRDLQYCTKVTMDVYNQRTLIVRIKEQVSRLLSPLL